MKNYAQKIDTYKISVKDRSIPPSDMQGATITLSNFGIDCWAICDTDYCSTAVAILGCGRSREAVVVKNGEMKAGEIVAISLTFDHRAATGGEATRYLRAVIKYLQEV